MKHSPESGNSSPKSISLRSALLPCGFLMGALSGWQMANVFKERPDALPIEPKEHLDPSEFPSAPGVSLDNPLDTSALSPVSVALESSRRELTEECEHSKEIEVDLLTLDCADPKLLEEFARLSEKFLTVYGRVMNECGNSKEVVPPDLKERLTIDGSDEIYEAYKSAPETLGDVGADNVFDLRGQLTDLVTRSLLAQGATPIPPGTDPNIPMDYWYGCLPGSPKSLGINTPEGEKLFLVIESGIYQVPDDFGRILLALRDAEEAFFAFDYKASSIVFE